MNPLWIQIAELGQAANQALLKCCVWLARWPFGLGYFFQFIFLIFFILYKMLRWVGRRVLIFIALISALFIATQQEVVKEYIDRWARGCRIAISMVEPAPDEDRFSIFLSTSGVMPNEISIVAAISLKDESKADSVPRIKSIRTKIPTAGDNRLVTRESLLVDKTEEERKSGVSQLSISIPGPLRGANHVAEVMLTRAVTEADRKLGWRVFGLVAIDGGTPPEKVCSVSSPTYFENKLGADGARIFIALVLLLFLGSLVSLIKKE